jgi:hypothetical protein
MTEIRVGSKVTPFLIYVQNKETYKGTNFKLGASRKRAVSFGDSRIIVMCSEDSKAERQTGRSRIA